MGAKFGKVDEADAHLSWDSPVPAGSGARYDLMPALNGSSIKILVWNLKKEELDGMEVDLPRESSDRHLLLLSEGYLNSRGRSIFDSLYGFHFDMGVSFDYKRDNNSPTGTMIASRVMPSWVKVQQTTDHEPIIGTPKCTTMAKYIIRQPGGEEVKMNDNGNSNNGSAIAMELLVISIHGINAVSASALDRQLDQSASVIRDHVGPVIFGGDFNTNLAVKVSRLRALIADLAMVEIPFRNGDDRKKVLGQFIDYVFTRGLKLVGEAEVLDELNSSDHKALKMELQLE